MTDSPRLAAALRWWDALPNNTAVNFPDLIAAIDAADPRFGPVTEEESNEAYKHFRGHSMWEVLTAFLAARGAAVRKDSLLTEATCKPALQVAVTPSFEADGKPVSFFAVRDGQWHYVNHAGTWQGCPPPFPAPVVTDEMVWRARDVYEHPNWILVQAGEGGPKNKMRAALDAALGPSGVAEPTRKDSLRVAPSPCETVLAAQGPEFVGRLPTPSRDADIRALSVRMLAVEERVCDNETLRSRMNVNSDAIGALVKRLDAIEAASHAGQRAGDVSYGQ